jgi:SAM-dependent methyltransferase
MAESPNSHRFYGELAEWWPLISPPEDYGEEAAYAAALLKSAEIPVRDVLELGSGGGHNASHLKAEFAMTLVDLSEQMLEVSRRLNPECAHYQGDMRTIRFDRMFDAVFVHDAVDYMTTTADLRRAMETAYVHCRPGGLALFAPDATAEIFEESTHHGGTDGQDGRGVRYLEWTRDPDSSDTWVVTDYVFLLHDAENDVRIVHESHRTGLFGRETWLQLLTDVGFEADIVTEETTEDRISRELFIGRRLSAPPR